MVNQKMIRVFNNELLKQLDKTNKLTSLTIFCITHDDLAAQNPAAKPFSRDWTTTFIAAKQHQMFSLQHWYVRRSEKNVVSEL
jgi:hypothetical protein